MFAVVHFYPSPCQDFSQYRVRDILRYFAIFCDILQYFAIFYDAPAGQNFGFQRYDKPKSLKKSRCARRKQPTRRPPNDEQESPLKTGKIRTPPK
jgi:hypothetical protein